MQIIFLFKVLILKLTFTFGFLKTSRNETYYSSVERRCDEIKSRILKKTRKKIHSYKGIKYKNFGPEALFFLMRPESDMNIEF